MEGENWGTVCFSFVYSLNGVFLDFQDVVRRRRLRKRWLARWY